MKAVILAGGLGTRLSEETLHGKRAAQIKIAEILDVHPCAISRALRRLGSGHSYPHRQAHRNHQVLKKRD
jgi:UDP-glucose 4-epimerase